MASPVHDFRVCTSIYHGDNFPQGNLHSSKYSESIVPIPSTKQEF